MFGSPDCMAGPTDPSALFRDVGASFGVGMPVNARVFSCVPCGDGIATEEIDSPCNHFQVTGVNASAVTAEVIPVEANIRFAYKEMMGLSHRKAPASFDTEPPITLRESTNPDHAVISSARIHVTPETNLRWSSLTLHRKSHPFGVTGQDALTSLPFYFTS